MTLKFKSFSPLFSLLSSVTMGLTLCAALSAHFQAEVAQADEVAYLNMVQNTIEYPRGNVVGSVVGGVAVDRKGRPFSKSPIGVRTLQRDDGKLLRVADDGTVHDAKDFAAAGGEDTPGSQLRTVGEELQRATAARAGANVVAAEVPGVEGSKANDHVPFNKAESQDDKYAGNPNVEPARSVSDVLMTGGTGGSYDYNSHIDALDNWSQLYEGVTKSPLIVDARKIDNKYPDLVAEPKESQRPQLGGSFGQKGAMEKPNGADLGADDEIMKTSMTVFQPIKRLQKDFLEDETARDAYLNSALTVRGIAVMTMGFLDKTVGAGLTAVQQQADMNTVQQLLKQISWTSSKMANGDRSASYRDVDEKLEACLELALVQGKAPDDIKGKTRKIVDYKCSDECGEPPSQQNYRVKQKGSDAQKKAGNGSYAYCVCCAETSSDLNFITDDGKTNSSTKYSEGAKDSAKNAAEKNEWSLVERAFYGTKIPTEGTGNDEAERIKKMVFFFKEMYGDVLMRKQQGNGGEPFFQTVYLYPKWSVSRKVLGFRNGCSVCDYGGCPVDDPGVDCPVEELGLKHGICPAIGEIIKNWDDLKHGRKQDVNTANLWTEASLGFPLTGYNVEAFVSANGTPDKKVEMIAGRMKRQVDAFCDASSVVAFTRYHSRLASIVNDHMALNMHVTSADKSKILGLVNRVTEQLQLAQADLASSYSVQNIYTGSAISMDRARAGTVASNAEASQSAQNVASHITGTNSFGNVASYFPQNANTAAARGTGGDGGCATCKGDDLIGNALNGIQ